MNKKTGSFAEFAAFMGYKSKASVAKKKKENRLVFTADGKIDFEKSKALITNTADIARPNKGTDNTAVPFVKDQYEQSRLEKITYEAKRQRLKYDVEVKKLGALSEIERLGFAIGRGIRNRLTTFARRAAPIVSIESEHTKNYEYLVTELEKIIDDVMKDIQKDNGDNTANG